MSNEELTFDPEKAVKAQEEYCKKNNAPFFAPNVYIGYKCYRCNQNIYKETGFNKMFNETRKGISVQEASSTLITGCPFCHASYCD